MAEREKYYEVLYTWERTDLSNGQQNGDTEQTAYRIKENAINHFKKLKEKQLAVIEAINIRGSSEPVISMDEDYIFMWWHFPTQGFVMEHTIKILMHEFAD